MKWLVRLGSVYAPTNYLEDYFKLSEKIIFFNKVKWGCIFKLTWSFFDEYIRKMKISLDSFISKLDIKEFDDMSSVYSYVIFLFGEEKYIEHINEILNVSDFLSFMKSDIESDILITVYYNIEQEVIRKLDDKQKILLYLRYELNYVDDYVDLELISREKICIYDVSSDVIENLRDNVVKILKDVNIVEKVKHFHNKIPKLKTILKLGF